MSRKLVCGLTRIALSMFATVTLWGCDEGVTDSATESEASGCSLVSTTAWFNQSFPEQSEMFHIELEATASTGGMDAVIGLSEGAATHWNKLAAIVRFTPAGTFAECGEEFAMLPQDFSRADVNGHPKVCRLCSVERRRASRRVGAKKSKRRS